MREKCQFCTEEAVMLFYVTQRNTAQLLSRMELSGNVRLRAQLTQPLRQDPTDARDTCDLDAFCLHRLETHKKETAQFIIHSNSHAQSSQAGSGRSGWPVGEARWERGTASV